MRDVRGRQAEGRLVSLHKDVETPGATGVSLAKKIRVVLRRGTGPAAGYSLQIDGQEFPWYVTEDGIDVSVSGTKMPAVRVTIMADSVEVIDEFLPNPAGFDAQADG